MRFSYLIGTLLLCILYYALGEQSILPRFIYQKSIALTTKFLELTLCHNPHILRLDYFFVLYTIKQLMYLFNDITDQRGSILLLKWLYFLK